MRLFYFLFAVLLLCSCKKQISFELNYSKTFVIDKTQALETATDIVSDTITTNIDAIYTTNQTNQKNVINIQLKDITFTVSNPSQHNFDFMKSIEIYLRADGLPERLISTQMNIPETGLTEITGELPNVNVIEYLSKPSYSLRFKVTIDQNIPEDFTLQVKQNFDVDAKKLKS
jgi:hypothetical protein